jgi:mycothiol synthase
VPLIRQRRAWRLEVEEGDEVPSVVAAAISSIAAAGGGELQWWVSGPTPATDRVAASLGLVARRDVWQVRLPLPLPAEEAPPLPVRPFVPGRDEQAWLEVNNRAFAWHPEQGDWDLATLVEREHEPWFDANGFLLYEEGGRLAGFCWTKVHPARVGEIFVIATDPHFGGRGLGRGLTVAGLNSLSQRGCTTGMLYVDESNTTARALYDHLGFTLDHVDRSYVTVVQAAPETPTSAPTA